MRAPGHRDLLADDGADGEFEAVRRSRHAASGVPVDDGPQQAIDPQGLPHGDGVGVEVEKLAAPGDGGRQVT